MGLKQIDHGTLQYAQMVQLRNQILREPLGLTITAEELDNEKNDILIAAFDDDEMMGCCILTPMDASTIRLRQMAVPASLQGKGIGASIMSFAEDLARDKGYSRMIMHARDTAIGFYEKFGFRVIGDPFTEVNLPHHIMEKVL
jgi:GNAT superfamily N-acetyltransferase